MVVSEMTVRALVDQFGNGAEKFAKRMAWRLTKSGNHESAEYWRDIETAIIRFRDERPAA